MPSPDITDNDPALAITNRSTTPRRSLAVRRAPNATPTRRKSTNNKITPNSAPTQTRPGAKKAEPTLLGDFLLGRPSVSRSRRKSLDVVKTEVKKAAVNRIQPPGGVKDRVKQWQKANAAAAVEDITGPPSEPDDMFLDMDGKSVTEDDRRRIKFRKNQKYNPGRRKSGEKDVGSPKKRVVSDDHWMMKEKKRSPPQDTQTVGGPALRSVAIPKDFLKRSINPPLEKKIEDWSKRTVANERKHSELLLTKDSKEEFTDVKFKILPNKTNSKNREACLMPSPDEPVGDKVNRESSDPEVRWRTTDDMLKGRRTSRSRSSKKHIPSNDNIASGRDGISTIHSSDGTSTSCTTPTPTPRVKVRHQKSASPESLADIPVGYSAFSVLDVPIGGDATARHRAKPQRQPSFSAVPKVLKRVYTGGMKIMHDTVDPPRIGVNQPPSIESWLKGTSDPFFDKPSMPRAVGKIASPKSEQRNRGSHAANTTDNVNENDTNKKSISEIRKRSLSGPLHEEVASLSGKGDGNLLSVSGSRENDIKEDAAPSLSPKSLRRSPATRNTSSPKSPRKFVLKDTPENQSDWKVRNNQTIKPADESELPDRWREKARDQGADTTGSQQQRRGSDIYSGHNKMPLPRSPRMVSMLKHDSPNLTDTVEPGTSGRSDRPTVGEHCLSTITSVETFRSSSPLTETTSGLSHTTATQTTISQNASRTSNVSCSRKTQPSTSHLPSSKLGLKRRLTKHSDLLSVLSLPDASAPGMTKSIRSARSVRTTRSCLEKATIPSLLQELVDDEAKYMRELKTLVDGVIPVLLTCVLSRSEAAVAAGLFNPSLAGKPGASVTKPIVDMGIALERLKSIHKHIPLRDSDLLNSWATGAFAVYEDYINAWRMGFQDVIVNLAPASPLESIEGPSPQDMPRNTEGDVLNENGERVDVAFLLKRPLVRVKYLAKVMKGMYMLRPSDQAARVDGKFQELLSKTRQRIKEEEARLEDQAANNTDATRARDPRTLAPMEGLSIDPTRQVRAKDYFDFGLPHSSGQRIDCRVELLFRDKPNGSSDVGDILVCEIDALGRWLLLPPIEVDHISARPGEGERELIVMITGVHDSKDWHEIFILTAADEETAFEWIQMLGLTPRPPEIPILNGLQLPSPSLPPSPQPTDSFKASFPLPSPSRTTSSIEADVPIGERRKAKDVCCEFTAQCALCRKKTNSYSPFFEEGSSNTLQEDPGLPWQSPRDVNDFTSIAKALSSPVQKRELVTGYRSCPAPKSPINLSSGNIKDDDISQRRNEKSVLSNRAGGSPSGNNSHIPDSDLRSLHLVPLAPPSISAHRRQVSEGSVTKESKNGPLRESMRPDNSTKNRQSILPATTKVRDLDDEAPPPPPHRSPTPLALKKAPNLTAITPNSKSRRSSSPLKHEYQPSDASGTSSASEDSDTGDSEDYSDSSEEEELEAVDLSIGSSVAESFGKKISPPESLCSLPNASLAPSNSASQALYLGAAPPPKGKTTKLVAAISCWSEKGRWLDLCPEDCSIAVSPGLIQAFIMSASHCASPTGDGHKIHQESLEIRRDVDSGTDRPLVALELTPIVPLRQSNALDIEIRSPPTAQSTAKCTHTVRFRSRTLQECSALYAAIHSARMENPIYKKLEQERIVSAYGKQSYHEAVGSNNRRSWFGRRKSYRASTRAPSVTVSENSIYSFASAISRLRHMGGIGGFNIAKSSIGISQGVNVGTRSGATSLYTRSTGSATSGTTPPQTPSSPSIAMTGTSQVVSLGSSNLKIRLYLLETTSRWNELGNALLTVTHPPRGMRQASSLYHGVEKRVIVTKRQGPKRTLSKKFPGSGSPQAEDSGPGEMLLDVVLGGGCFSRLGVVGIVMNVWEDVVGDNGEVGTVGAIGGLSGRTRKWMFQCASAAEATWIFALVGGGGR